MADKISEGKIMQALNWAYDKALDGTIPGTNSSYEMAENYLKGEGDLAKKVNSLIGVSLDIENYCTLRLFFDLPNLAGLSRRNLPADGIRLLFHI